MVRTTTSTSITLTQWAEESRSCIERLRTGQGIMIQIILVLPGGLLQQQHAVLCCADSLPFDTSSAQ